ncbi:MAG: hypothetical protein ND866_28310 [Pyrinomonadaceae bacterium]|nr:hypothetical protein [Pyrinomonadaceae bacterium]
MTSDGPATYAIWVKGALSPEWEDRLGGLQVRQVPASDQPITELVGTVVDQTALTGLLTTLYELGLTILSVERLHDLDAVDQAK